MKKKFVRVMLFSALTLTTAASFVGCKDYDDDIKNVQEQVDQLKKDLSDLKGSIGDNIKSLTYDAATGTLTVTGGDGTSASVKIAQNLPTYSLSIVDGKVVLTGTDGSKSEATLPVAPAGESFDPSKLTIDANGVVFYDGEKTGVKMPTVAGSITEVKNGDVVIGYTIKMNDQTATFSVVDAVPLKSIVFEPQAYLNGVEAMKAVNVTYNAWTLNKSDKPATDKGEIWNAPVVPAQVGNITPYIVAYYHLNPSSVTMAQIKSLKYIYDDKEFIGTRSAKFNPEVIMDQCTVVNGVLKVVIKATSQEIQKIDADMISVMSLQATTNVDGKEDKLVTSDYAAIYKSTIKNLVLADNTIDAVHHTHLYGADNANALVGKAEDAINNNPIHTVAYNDKKGIDLSKIVETHYTEWTDEATPKQIGGEKVMSKVGDFGMKYVYTLSNYYQGTNQTEQNDFANLTPEGVLTAKVFDATGDPYAAVGRMPLVRVQLVDVATNAVINTGWIKVKIVKDKVAAGNWDKNFGVFALQCDPKDFSTTVEEMNVNIYNKLGLSKAEFHALYTLDVDGSGNAVLANTTDNGVVTEVVNSDGNTETTILKWTLTSPEVVADADGKFTATVTYKAKDADSRGDFTITFTTQVSKPSGTIADENKIKEYWDDAKKYVRLNVETLDAANTCAFATNLDNAFVGNTLKVSGVDVKFTDFAADKLAYKFIFASDNNNVEATDENGTIYVLSVSNDGQTLYAKHKGNTDVQVVAIVDPTSHVVTYQATANALALLNRSAHNVDPFSAIIDAVVVNECGMQLPLTNEKFEAKFLRPVNVTKNKDGKFVDATNNGSVVNLLDLITLTDWRDHKFVVTPDNYYTYYGVTDITVDIDNIRSSLNNDNFAHLLTDITKKIVISQQKKADTTTPDFGTVTYKNNGNAVGAFQLKIPVIVTHKWGKVTEWVIVDVEKTQGN